MNLAPALIAAVARAERLGAGAVKERARAIRAVDQAAGGTGLRELRTALAAQGIDLTQEQVRVARKIAGLLHDLDPAHLDPPGLLGYYGEQGTLYWLARAAEVTARPAPDLLSELQLLGTNDARDEQLRAWTRRAPTAPPPETPWVTPLPPVPDETAARLRDGHARFARALELTDLQATDRLGDLLTRAPDSLWRVLAELDDQSLGTLGAALSGASRCLVDAPHEQRAPMVVRIIAGIAPAHWRALHAAYLKGTQHGKQTNKQDCALHSSKLE